jgi:hypothetical protein
MSTMDTSTPKLNLIVAWLLRAGTSEATVLQALREAVPAAGTAWLQKRLEMGRRLM